MTRTWIKGLVVVIGTGGAVVAAGSSGCAQVIGLDNFVDCPGDPSCPADATCHDGVKDGQETGVDCGGPCPPCAVGVGCVVGTDCTTHVCIGGTCAAPSCHDGIQNGQETDVDCGGPVCQGCSLGEKCKVDSDCRGGLCIDGSCAPSCTDGVKDGNETGMDCGGGPEPNDAGVCPRCANDGGCMQSTDCESTVCHQDVCVPTYVWAESFPNTGTGTMPTTTPSVVTTDAKNNVILTGAYSGTLHLGSTPIMSEEVTQGESSGFLAKYDENGVFSWNKSYGSPDASVRPLGLTTDQTGNIYFSGIFTAEFPQGASCDLLAASGVTASFVNKLDQLGNAVWCKALGPDTGMMGNAYVQTMGLDPQGDIVVAGWYNGSVDFGNGTSVIATNPYDLFVLKLDPSGNYLWAQDYGGGPLPGIAPTALAIDSVGNIALAGTFDGTLNFGQNAITSQNGTNVFGAEISPSGGYMWSSGFGALGAGVLAIDRSNNVVIGGFFSKTITIGGMPFTSAGLADIFLAKFTSAGSLQWAKTFGDASDQEGTAVSIDLTGNIVLASRVEGTVDFGGGPVETVGGPTGGPDICLTVFDTNGNYLWNQQYGDINLNVPRVMAIDSTGAALLGGSFEGTLNFGGPPNSSLVATGTDDMFLAKLNVP